MELSGTLEDYGCKTISSLLQLQQRPSALYVSTYNSLAWGETGLPISSFSFILIWTGLFLPRTAAIFSRCKCSSPTQKVLWLFPSNLKPESEQANQSGHCHWLSSWPGRGQETVKRTEWVELAREKEWRNPEEEWQRTKYWGKILGKTAFFKKNTLGHWN